MAHSYCLLGASWYSRVVCSLISVRQAGGKLKLSMPRAISGSSISYRSIGKYMIERSGKTRCMAEGMCDQREESRGEVET